MYKRCVAERIANSGYPETNDVVTDFFREYLDQLCAQDGHKLADTEYGRTPRARRSPPFWSGIHAA